MTDHFDLAHRAKRCVRYANDGNATILLITEAQRDEATRLIGEAPVIVATSKETVAFLKHWMRAAFEDAPRRRRR